MDRRAFLGTLAGGLLAAPLAATAQAGKVDRIGYLGAGSPRSFLPEFEQGLRERGWVLGENLVINYRHAEGKYDRLPVLATELAQAEPRVIVVSSTAAAHAARNATSTIPIVMWGVADPIGEGLVSSLARPGGNVTGVTGVPSFETHGKYLQLLKEAVPHARRIAVLRNPANPASLPSLKVLKETAQTFAVDLQIVEARASAEFAPAFRAVAQARADALLLYYDAAFNPHLRRLADLSLRGHLPTMCGDPGYAKAGGFMNYSVNYADTVFQVAGYVDRLLRGARPAELPVELPTKFDLVINLKTAKALGLTIPPSLLQRADQVIE